MFSYTSWKFEHFSALSLSSLNLDGQHRLHVSQFLYIQYSAGGGRAVQNKIVQPNLGTGHQEV